MAWQAQEQIGEFDLNLSRYCLRLGRRDPTTPVEGGQTLRARSDYLAPEGTVRRPRHRQTVRNPCAPWTESAKTQLPSRVANRVNVFIVTLSRQEALAGLVFHGRDGDRPAGGLCSVAA